ncbi:3'-5' exonuclease [Thiomicrorhabdus immobilis]|uniref:3'-5' exonuclease n=1 Tax=Thiomicrorhabdus immobilis TaxID=2791037 RepID=A0ABN6CW50_9GAMM|nr:3'-5' exonuclease [Thiomicrorhabdus immobilis]BCN93283.1 3'-5' exonuclease [Thiomicrorhabdus immobilis]
MGWGLKHWFVDKLHQWRKRQLKDSQYGFIFDQAISGKYVCFDCETTGLNPKKDKIITLSAIKVEGNQLLTSQSLNLTIKQDQSISAASIQVHQIRNMDVEQNVHTYEDEREAITQFLQFIHQATLVGYYLEFDIEMVNQVIKPWLGVKLPNPRIEVSELFYQRELAKQNYGVKQVDIDLRFERILNKLDLPNIGQHDAFSDALMTALIFVKLQQDR